MSVTCVRKNPTMSQYSNWGEETKLFIARHLGKTPPATAKICRKDQLDAIHHHNDLNYEPKWKVDKTQMLLCCIYPQCNKNSSQVSIVMTSFAPDETLRQIIDITGSDKILLCKQHYNIIYRQVNPSKKCASCHANPKIGTSFQYHSPDPQKKLMLSYEQVIQLWKK